VLEIKRCAHFSIENITILSPNHRHKGHPEHLNLEKQNNFGSRPISNQGSAPFSKDSAPRKITKDQAESPNHNQDKVQPKSKIPFAATALPL
jgi:hypothetical protein